MLYCNKRYICYILKEEEHAAQSKVYPRRNNRDCAEYSRRKGKSALNARDLGAALGTSTRPVFTAFKNMSELIEEVKKAAMKRFESYSRNEPGVPAFKSVGMQMISFATNEPKLFQVLYMSERTQTGDFDDLFSELGDTADTALNA